MPAAVPGARTPGSGIAPSLLIAAALVCPGVSGAHGPGGAAGEPLARLGALAPELAGVRVQIHHTLAPQVVLENPTGRTLEVFDEAGAAFLRVGPRGVEGNLAAPAWYRGFAPPEAEWVPPSVAEDASSGERVEPRWVRVRAEPSWGWFDSRLDAGGAGDGQHWEIPVRIGDVRTALSGPFEKLSPPRGTLRARLVSERQLAPGVRLSLLPGAAGSFFLKNDSGLALTVLGRDGEAFLRFGPTKVEANLHSATFAEVARVRGGAGLALEPRADAAPRWQEVSSAPRYGWVDPRTAWDPGDVAAEVIEKGVAVELLRWSIPMRIGEGDDASLVRIEGVTVWEPFASGHAGRAG